MTDSTLYKGAVVHVDGVGLCNVLKVSPKTATVLVDKTSEVLKNVRHDRIHIVPSPAPDTRPATAEGSTPAREKTTHGTLITVLIVGVLFTAINYGWPKLQETMKPDPQRELVRVAVEHQYPELLEKELVDKLIAANDGTLTAKQLVEIVRVAAPAIQQHTWKAIAAEATAAQDANGVFSESKPKGKEDAPGVPTAQASLDTLLQAAKKELQACRK